MKFCASPFKLLVILLAGLIISCQNQEVSREVIDFNNSWYFTLADSAYSANISDFDHSEWRLLNVPHDWSIEGEFSKDHPATAGGGALPGGIGWYRKEFKLDSNDKDKRIFIQFDGVYMKSTVWVNGHFIGSRPFGYISFEYDLTDKLNYDGSKNVIAVKVDNSEQPNSRWYSGSGIYRNTRLVKTSQIFVPQWGVYVKTPSLSEEQATVSVEATVINQSGISEEVKARFTVVNDNGQTVSAATSAEQLTVRENIFTKDIELNSPQLWTLDDPHLYTLRTEIILNGEILDQYETPFGVRDFDFDLDKGFTLNGVELKIKGVCMHHDLGCLGAAINTRALERQLEILRGMGVNAIRTSHNPPAPQLLDLCDRMGFLVVDETFDIWSMKKSPYDYALYWNEWHEKDFVDHIKRDRNHPSVILWSIGNEIIDQWSPKGDTISKELAAILKPLDNRPISAGMNPPINNTIAGSKTLDLIGYNYHHQLYEQHRENFPTVPFIATETSSALATRGYYDKKSDTLKRWPIRWDQEFLGGNEGNTVSAYDQVSAPWGSTHEETWKIMKRNKYLAGMFIWTGFDYLGEPTPYTWPSRSSYFGVVDIAGFPKDSYYMYQSEWTDQDVLHVFPHWNWEGRDSVDVWAYYNNADGVELFLNGESQGVKSKSNEELHVMWRLPYEPGELKAISRKGGQEVLSRKIETTGEPYQIRLTPDRTTIKADGKDLSFVTVEILDEEGRLVPVATNLVEFTVEGAGKNVGVDNGDPTSHLSLKGDKMNAMAGKCLLVVQSGNNAGKIQISAKAEGLQSTSIELTSINE